MCGFNSATRMFSSCLNLWMDEYLDTVWEVHMNVASFLLLESGTCTEELRAGVEVMRGGYDT